MVPRHRVLRVELYVVFFSLLGLGNPVPTYLRTSCPTPNLYTPNGTYKHNLDNLLSSLYRNARYGTGFHNASYGNYPDTVYGSFMCRGDVTADLCLDCVATAAQEVGLRCPKQKDAITWYDECQLRYSSRSFFAIVDEGMFSSCNGEEMLRSDRFSKVLGATMKTLMSQVAFDPSRRMFGTKEANISTDQTLYCLAQCTLDLSGRNCSGCLADSLAYLPTFCGGKKGGRVLQASCNIRYELYPFYGMPALTTTLSPLNPLLRNSTNHGGKDVTPMPIILAVVLPSAFSVMVLLKLVYFLLIRKEENYVGNEAQPDDSFQFDMRTIRSATDNFSDRNKIDEGVYGDVYKGILPSGLEIAVKRLPVNSGETAEAFKNEALLISRLQHRNLQRLMGFCSEEQKILIYEFMPNKSLDSFLCDSEKRAQLNWPKRHRIISGIARGLLYLHEDAPLKIIHRDLKASNILLDGKMNAKISNFATNSHRAAVTYGNMAPECVVHGQFSTQSDVYSFGILLMEIVSGMRNECSNQPDHSMDLVRTAWRYWNERQTIELNDPIVRECCPITEVMKCIHIGFLCIQEDPEDRPTMELVVNMLSSDSSTLLLPRQLPPSSARKAEPQRTEVEVYAQTMGSVESNGTDFSKSIGENYRTQESQLGQILTRITDEVLKTQANLLPCIFQAPSS